MRHQPSNEDWERLQSATKDFMEYHNKTFGYIHGSEYRDPINRAIFALRLAREHLESQVIARQKAVEELYQYLEHI